MWIGFPDILVSRCPAVTFTLFPETPAAVTKIMLGSKTVPVDVSVFVVSAGDCEESIETQSPLYQFHWHGPEMDELESFLPAWSLLFRRV